LKGSKETITFRQW